MNAHRLLDGDALAAVWRAELAMRASALRLHGLKPKLGTILVGEDPASAAYVARKHADCSEVGVAVCELRLGQAASQAEVLHAVARLNADPEVQGVLLQLPLPPHLDAGEALRAIDPAKDADGLHPSSLGSLVRGEPGPRPCTPAAILGLLAHYSVPLAGRRIAVIGRGVLVGRPLALMLSEPRVNALVTVLHTGSDDLAEVTRECDVVISATGRPGLVTASMLKRGAAVVGVGIAYRDGVMVSDIADDAGQAAGWVTPRHGSVGPLTRARLLHNLLDLVEPPPGCRPCAA